MACTLVVWDLSFDLWSLAAEKQGCVRQSGRRGSRASPPHALRRRWLVILRKVGRDRHEPTSRRTPAILSAPLEPPEFGRGGEPEFWSFPSRGQWWGVGVFWPDMLRPQSWPKHHKARVFFFITSARIPVCPAGLLSWPDTCRGTWEKSGRVMVLDRFARHDGGWRKNHKGPAPLVAVRSDVRACSAVFQRE